MSGTKGASFDFYFRDGDAAKRFFAPLPAWHSEAMQQNIEVARVPDWMKPGEPPASWSFTEWLDRRSAWLIPASGMLVFGVLGFLVGRRVETTTVCMNGRVEGVRSDEGVL